VVAAERFTVDIVARERPGLFIPVSKMSPARVCGMRALRQIPSCSAISRETSVPSARPLVSRIT